MTVEAQSCFMPPKVPAGLPPKSRSKNPSSTSTMSTSSASKEKAAMKSTSDNAVVMQLAKTKMCAFFERGKCASGNCRYAHSASELRSSPNLSKTKLCKAFLNGGCSVGENCGFAHGEADLRVTHGIYKTQICNFYERGYCKKADRCNHAHGSHDLRPPAKAQQPPPSSERSRQSSEATLYRRNLLPLAELINDAEAPPLQEPADDTPTQAGMSPFGSMIPPSAPFDAMQGGPGSGGLVLSSPQKSVTELASLAFSPMPDSPLATSMWQYPMSPATRAFAGSPYDSGARSFPGRDPVDMLIDQQLKTPLMERYDPQASPASRATIGTPLTDRYDPQISTPMMTYLPDVPMTPQSPADILDLNERLASLDSALVGLSADIASRSATKRIHRI